MKFTINTLHPCHVLNGPLLLCVSILLIPSSLAELPALMQHFWFFVLFILAAVPLTYVATPVVPWGDMKVVHAWNAIPINWETLGHPSAGSTVDLYVVLEPDLDAALTDALSEISNPNHPRYIFLSNHLPMHLLMCRRSVSDTGHSFRRNRLTNLSDRPQTRSSLYVHGLHTTAYHPPPSQGHMEAPG